VLCCRVGVYVCVSTGCNTPTVGLDSLAGPSASAWRHGSGRLLNGIDRLVTHAAYRPHIVDLTIASMLIMILPFFM
jgi:hypothetical protein